MSGKEWRGNIRAVFLAAEMAFRMNVFDGFIIFTVLIQPLIIAMMAMWMLGERGAEAAVFVVVGSGMTGLWSSSLFISGNSITWERWTGTLEHLVGQPTPMHYIVLGKNLAHVGQSLGSMIVAYLLAALVFDYSLKVAQPALFVVALLLTVVAFVCFGLIIAPLFVMNPSVQSWQNGLEFPVYILCGFLFPVAMLPGWTTPLSYVLAPYWAARALHGTSSGGADVKDVLFSFAMLLVFSAAYILISRFMFRALLRKARTDATLGME